MTAHRMPQAVHPLFDQTSSYGLLRAGLRPEGKMRGYIHFLRARARHASELIAARQWSPEELKRWALLLNIEESARVLDVWLGCAYVLRCDRDAPLEVSQREIAFCLIRETNGQFTIGGRGLFTDLKSWGQSNCRSFFLEPEVIRRLQGIVQHGHWQDAFNARTLTDNFEVARILAAAPELDGLLNNGEFGFDRLAVPEGYEMFPPRTSPLTIALVVSGQPYNADPSASDAHNRTAFLAAR